MVGRPKKYHTLEELKAAQKKQRAAYAKTDKSKERHKRYIQRILNDPIKGPIFNHIRFPHYNIYVFKCFV